MIGRHKFASGIADSADLSLVLASDWNATILLGHVFTNRTGGTLTAGDVVAIDSANDSSVVLADTAGARRDYVAFVCAMPSSSSHTPGSTINNLEQGIFLPVGAATVKVAGATTRGNYLRKSATSKALEDTGVAVSSAPPGDALATALGSTGGAGTVAALFSGLPVSLGGNLKSIQVFTSSGTWTRPAGIRRVWVEVVGGAAGGGGVASTGASGACGAGGGGAGGYAAKLIDVATISSATITIGGGGAGGAAGSNNGSNGGDSSWVDGTNTVVGGGGIGGQGSAGDFAGNGGSGGTASGGNINVQGQYGFSGYTDFDVAGQGGPGGTSRYGFGGPASTGAASSAGQSGSGNGSGGSGAHNRDNDGTARAGGSGTPGVIVVFEYE